MSSYVWKLKERGETPNVNYRILKKAMPYNPTARRCALCIAEKVEIAKGDDKVMLNKKCLKVRQKLGTRENLKIFENLKIWKFLKI